MRKGAPIAGAPFVFTAAPRAFSPPQKKQAALDEMGSFAVVFRKPWHRCADMRSFFESAAYPLNVKRSKSLVNVMAREAASQSLAVNDRISFDFIQPQAKTTAYLTISATRGRPIVNCARDPLGCVRSTSPARTARRRGALRAVDPSRYRACPTRNQIAGATDSARSGNAYATHLAPTAKPPNGHIRSGALTALEKRER